MGRNPSCIICDQPALRQQLDALLQSGMTANDAAIKLHIARATAYRHRKKCWVNRKSEKVAWSRFDPDRDKLYVRYEQDFKTEQEMWNTLPDFKENDCLFVVRYQDLTGEALRNANHIAALFATPAAHFEALIGNAPPPPELSEEIIPLETPEPTPENPTTLLSQPEPAPQPPRTLTPPQSARQKWLHGSRLSLYED